MKRISEIYGTTSKEPSYFKKNKARKQDVIQKGVSIIWCQHEFSHVSHSFSFIA